MVAVAIRNDMLAQTRTRIVPAEFATTDRICQRWAVSVGLGLPTAIWQDGVASRPPPLDDDTAIIVDQIILKSPDKTRKVVVKWYRTQLPNTVIAEQLNLTPRTLETAWKLALNFLQWRFIESHHAGVLALLKFRE
jgi:DNA-directed RNA polymerase specialized sigma24 family protein